MSARQDLELPQDHERELLRDSLRKYLAELWPAGQALERSADDSSVAVLWQGLAQQGLTALGADPALGGLREMCIAMQELGRAGAPVSLAGSAVFNLGCAWAGAAVPGELLDEVHSGGRRLALSWGELDPDASAAELALDGSALTGVLRFVENAASATDLLVATPDGLALVELRAEGVSVAATVAMDGPGWCEVRLRRAPFTLLELSQDALLELRAIGSMLLLARACGAARRAFELAVDYAKERKQFGQPIGRFQAMQHKLANGLIALEGAGLVLDSAATSRDLRLGGWRYHADAAVAFGAEALRQVALETQHAFGAIGYAQEHEAPRHFRRVHLDTALIGGSARARASLASALLDAEEASLPEYDLGAAGNAFREEVREWLARNWSGERKAAYDAQPFHDREFDAAFARDLGGTGWLGLSWPESLGGQQRSPMEQLAFLEVMERAEAPPRFGASVQANALIMHGTPEQQAHYLPEILAGEAMHGMGYSEPGSGSDLASLRTSAVRQGDHWVINGQKIWTTTWWGKYMFLAARTDPRASPPHAGISMFIVPMDSPGIEVKPARTMYGGTFANIFYDDVRIPLDHIVGPVNGGWRVLTSALAMERGLVGGGIVLKVVHGFEQLCREVRRSETLRRDPVVRDRIGQLAAEIEVGRRLMIHCAQQAAQGTTPAHLGAISKVFSGELMERYGEAALDILGPRAALSQGAEGALQHGRFEQQLRHSLMWVISIGTNEIQRSLIAQLGLGLPR